MAETKTTKKCSFPFRIHLIFPLLLVLFSSSVVSEESKWTLAGYKFSLSQKSSSSKMNEAWTSSLPSLILEQIAENLERKPRADELLARKTYTFRKDRLALFLQLSKEVQARDAIFLQDYTPSRLKSKLKASDKKIKKIQKQIDDNLDSEKKVRLEYAPQIEKDLEREKDIDQGKVVSEDEKKDGFHEFFSIFSKKDQFDVPLEKIVLYGNDSGKLFTYDKEKNFDSTEEMFTSYEFQKCLTDASVNGLVTGKLTVYGSYVSVSVNLYQYPGGKIIGTAIETGQSNELDVVAKSIAMQLTPKMAEAMPVELSFQIESDVEDLKTSLSVDDVIYKTVPEKIIIQGGVHSLLFFADEMKSVSINHNFSGNRKFLVSVTMKKNEETEINLAILKNLNGSVFLEGKFGKKISSDDNSTLVKVNGDPILGHFLDDSKMTADFYIPQKLLSEEYLKVNLKPMDRSKYIDSRRRWMYASYSALIVSLIPAFYCYGNYSSAANAYNNGNGVSYSEAHNWQTASNVCTGISIGCGVLFVYELFRYLKAANTVIPSGAKKISPKELLKIKKQKEKTESDVSEKTSEAESSENENSKTENVGNNEMQTQVYDENTEVEVLAR